jgi:hypothetical protein
MVSQYQAAHRESVVGGVKEPVGVIQSVQMWLINGIRGRWLNERYSRNKAYSS